MANKGQNKDERLMDIYRLCHLIRQTSDAIYKTREYELKKYKLSPVQAGALVGINCLGSKASCAELSRWIFKKSNSTTILLNRMQKMGLIEKKADAKHKNIIRLSLTPKGYEAYKHSIEFEAFAPLIKILSTKKERQLWSLLQHLRLFLFSDLRLEEKAYSSSLDQALILNRDKP